jgi:hypothetical protein
LHALLRLITNDNSRTKPAFHQSHALGRELDFPWLVVITLSIHPLNTLFRWLLLPMQCFVWRVLVRIR